MSRRCVVALLAAALVVGRVDATASPCGSGAVNVVNGVSTDTDSSVSDAVHHVTIHGCHNVVIGSNDVVVGSDVNITGSSDTVESNTVANAGDKIIVIGSGDTIIGNTVTAAANSGLFTGTHVPWATPITSSDAIVTQATNATVMNNTFGVFLDNGSSKLTFVNNSIPDGGVKVDWGDFNNTVRNNLFGDQTATGNSGATVALGTAENNVVSDNVLMANIVWIDNGADRNIIARNSVGGVLFIAQGADRNLIADNEVGNVLLVEQGANGNVLQGNVVDSVAYLENGVDYNQIVNNSVANLLISHRVNRNIIERNNLTGPLQLKGNVENNTVDSNKAQGLTVDYGAVANVVFNNSMGGDLTFKGGVNGNVVEDNIAQRLGMLFLGAQDNVVVSNSEDYVYFGDDADRNVVENNKRLDTTHTHTGIRFRMGAHDNLAESNTADYIVFQYNADRNTVINTTVASDYVGLDYHSMKSKLVLQSDVADNTVKNGNVSGLFKLYDFAEGDRIMNVSTAGYVRVGAFASTLPTAPPNPSPPPPNPSPPPPHPASPRALPGDQ